MTLAAFRRCFVGCIVLVVACAQGQRAHDAPSSILDSVGDSVHVRLLDASTVLPIANSVVELTSDNGIRCIKAPCPTDGKQWKGASDANGHVVIPKSALNSVATIKSVAYQGDLLNDATPGAKGEWNVELFSEESGDPGPHPLKLIDASTHAAIANAKVRIETRHAGGATDTVSVTTNALGWLFVPFRVVTKDAENSWLVVPAYQPARIDFSWARRKMLLDRR